MSCAADRLGVRTHERIDAGLCGRPVDLGPGRARVELRTLEEMAADEHGLVHGGFVFGLADYAAMLAVNEPTVVLGKAATRFLGPVRVGASLVAEARVESSEGKRHQVAVEVRDGDRVVVAGEFTCYVTDGPVLDAAPEA